MTTRDVALDSLYRAPINLWVEDALTREYLSRLWNDQNIAFFIGGGNDGVQAIVKDAEDRGFLNVFGLTDRDFRPSNKDMWNDPRKTFGTFILPVHEIENYLLDASALASCRYNNLKRSSDQIEERMKKAADKLCWWAACRDVVAELKRRFRGDFVSDPSCGLQDRTEAKRHICESSWYRKLRDEVECSSEQDIDQLLIENYTKARGLLRDGGWRFDFAGKEILHDIRGWIFDKKQGSRDHSSQARIDTDLAQEVADYQDRSSSIPGDLIELHAALKTRIARIPSQSP